MIWSKFIFDFPHLNQHFDDLLDLLVAHSMCGQRVKINNNYFSHFFELSLWFSWSSCEFVRKNGRCFFLSWGTSTNYVTLWGGGGGAEGVSGLYNSNNYVPLVASFTPLISKEAHFHKHKIKLQENLQKSPGNGW